MKLNIKKQLREALKLKSWDEYLKLVADAYNNAPNYEASAVKHWKALNDSNYTLFKRLLSKINVVFTTTDKSNVGSLNIMGRNYEIVYLQNEPYNT